MLKSISIRNFRNIKNENLNFERNNLIIGNNGEGKTSLLESIYYSCYFKSFLTNQDRDIIKIDKNFFYLKSKYNEEKIEIYYDKKNKIIRDNEKLVNKISNKFGHKSAVLFSNNDIEIIEDSMRRKRFFNFYISQINKNYLELLSKYNKILNQKRESLKSGHFKLIRIYNKSLSQLSADIGKIKNDFFLKLEKKFIEIINNKNFSIKYDFTENVEEWEKKFDKIFNSEIDNRVIYEGTHKEDIKFLNKNKIIKKIGSEGQKKMYIVYVKIAILFLLVNINKNPILLIDDIISKLDKKNYGLFFEILKNDKHQKFFTSMNKYENQSINFDKIFKVEDGIFRIY